MYIFGNARRATVAEARGGFAEGGFSSLVLSVFPRKLAEGFTEYVCLCWWCSFWKKQATRKPTMKQICFEWTVCSFGSQAVMQGEASQGVLGSVLSSL